VDKYSRDIAEGNLYKDELFIIPENGLLSLSGSYSFPLLFIVNHKENKAINEEDMTFVNSILKQIPNDKILSTADIGTVNLNKNDTSILSIIQKFKPKYIITWNCDDNLKGVEKSLLRPLYLGDICLINGPAISAIKENKEQKSQLWQSMKITFNIS